MDLYSANTLVSFLILSLSFLFAFKKTGDTNANKWLALALFLLANLVYLFAIIMDSNSEFKEFFFAYKFYLIGWFASFAYYPALYIYVKKSIGLKEDHKWENLLHFIFPALQMGYLLFLFIFNREIFYTIDTDIRVVSTSFDNPYMALPRLMINFVNLFYKIWALIRLAQYFRILDDYASTNIRENFEWIKQLLIATMVTHTAIMAYFTAVRDNVIMEYFPLSYLIIVYFIVVKAINHEIFEEYSLDAIRKKLSSQGDDDRDEGRESKDFEIINKFVLENSSYKIDKLSVKELSDFVDIPAYRITASLRTQSLNFFDYINRLRIEAAKIILSDDEQGSRLIDDIADEVGFNSRVTFIQSFKKYENSTPHAYRLKGRISE